MKVICWDIDDVLNDLTFEWVNHYNSLENDAPSITYSEFFKNPPVNRISLDEYQKSLDSFRSCHFLSLKPQKEIMSWFKNFGGNYIHTTLTAAPLKYANLSSAWLFSNFGIWIRSFNFVPSPRAEDEHITYDKTKADFVKRNGNIDIFVDDNEDNVNSVKNLGIKTVLFPRPWNSNKSLNIAWVIENLNASNQ